MDSRHYQNNLEIQNISGTQWKDLCKELSLKQIGRRDELRVRVTGFLYSPEGSRRVNEVPGSALLINVLRLLKLPLPRPKPVPKMNRPEEAAKACVCGQEVQAIGVICVRCGSMQHRNCMGKAASMPAFECPMCQLSQVEPYEQILEVVLAPSLTTTIGITIVQKQFVYTEDMNRRLMENGHRRLLQIRCIRLDEEGFTYHWPQECTVLLNNKALFTFSQPPASCSRKRKDSSLTISALGIGFNQAMVMRQKEEDEYAFGIFIVEVLTADAVFRRLATTNVVMAEIGKSFVQNRFQSGPNELPSRDFKTPIKCPLTRLLPEVPARCLKCIHLQCFDLRAYIVLQERAKSNRWRCPICNVMGLNVVVDRFMQQIIAEANEKKADHVEFHADGTYTMVAEEQDDDDTVEVIRKRPEPKLELLPPAKRPRLGLDACEKFAWLQFSKRNSHAEKVTSEALRASLSYQKAKIAALRRYVQSSKQHNGV